MGNTCCACCSVLAVRKESWVLDTLGHTLLRHAAGADGNSFSYKKSQPERPKYIWTRVLITSVFAKFSLTLVDWNTSLFIFFLMFWTLSTGAAVGPSMPILLFFYSTRWYITWSSVIWWPLTATGQRLWWRWSSLKGAPGIMTSFTHYIWWFQRNSSEAFSTIAAQFGSVTFFAHDRVIDPTKRIRWGNSISYLSSLVVSRRTWFRAWCKLVSVSLAAVQTRKKTNFKRDPWFEDLYEVDPREDRLACEGGAQGLCANWFR